MEESQAESKATRKPKPNIHIFGGNRGVEKVITKSVAWYKGRRKAIETETTFPHPLSPNPHPLKMENPIGLN